MNNSRKNRAVNKATMDQPQEEFVADQSRPSQSASEGETDPDAKQKAEDVNRPAVAAAAPVVRTPS